MTTMTPNDRLNAVRNALAALTVSVERAAPDTPVSAFDDLLERASRAVARMQVLAAMHPDLTVADIVPRGACEDSTIEDHQARMLLADATRPDGVNVILFAKAPDHEAASILADRFDGAVIHATYSDDQFVADISSLVLAAALELFPNDDQEVL